ncbi:MAG: glycosyltransferase family 4 protein [Desulfobulbaceae bacterium]
MPGSSEPPLILHTDWSRSWGGQEIRTLTELQEMRKLGFRTAMMVPEDSELARRGRREKMMVWPVEFRSKFHPGSWKEIIAGIRHLRPAVVNTHSSEDSWMAGPVARLLGVPLVIRTRHVLQPVSSTFSYRVFPHMILACSEAIRDGLVEEGISRERIVVQPTGIDEERFRFSEEKRREIRSRYGIGDDEILVGNVGFFRVYKGQIFIVRTAAKMPDRFRFMLVGDGDDRSLLEAERDRLGLGERLILTGHQERPEDFFSAFDILFFSSWSVEGIAQSYIQGLLYGLPLLACRTPSILEPLSCVHAYRLIDYDDIEAARQGLMELSRLPYDEEGRAAQRAAIASRYGVKTMTANLLAVYERFGIRVNGSG